MSKNLLIIEGSPRKKGNSSALAAFAAEGARKAGAQVETVHLHGMKIAPCNHCDGCIRNGVYCTVEDDMETIYPKLHGADALLLASPIYWFTYTGQLKVCIDRWYGLWNLERNFLKGKPVGIILTYGDEDLYSSGGINAMHTFETMFRFLEAPIAGWVHGTMMDIGEAEKNPTLLKQAEKLGRKLAEGMG